MLTAIGVIGKMMISKPTKMRWSMGAASQAPTSLKVKAMVPLSYGSSPKQKLKKEIVQPQRRFFLKIVESRLALSPPGSRNAIMKLIQEAGKPKK